MDLSEKLLTRHECYNIFVDASVYFQKSGEIGLIAHVRTHVHTAFGIIHRREKRFYMINIFK